MQGVFFNYFHAASIPSATRSQTSTCGHQCVSAPRPICSLAWYLETESRSLRQRQNRSYFRIIHRSLCRCTQHQHPTSRRVVHNRLVHDGIALNPEGLRPGTAHPRDLAYHDMRPSPGGAARPITAEAQKPGSWRERQIRRWGWAVNDDPPISEGGACTH